MTKQEKKQTELNSEGTALHAGITKRFIMCLQRDMAALNLKFSRQLRERKAEQLPQYYLDELRLGKLLGAGSFARVYEVQSIECSREGLPATQDTHRALLASCAKRRNKDGKPSIVVKHLRSKFLRKPHQFRAAARELMLEAHVLASIQHPHIITVRGLAAGGACAYANGRTDGFFFLMDRIECTLSDRIEQWRKQIAKFKKPFVQKVCGEAGMNRVLYAGRLQVARDIASALSYLHDRRLVHRDVKPMNIGFDANGTVKLLDFGLVCELSEKQLCLTRAGSPRYMAPENYHGHPYDESVDVYSLTIVLWEILALAKFFEDLLLVDLRVHVLQKGERPNVDMSWPYGIRSLIRRGWSASHERPTMCDYHKRLVYELQNLNASSSFEDDSTWKNESSSLTMTDDSSMTLSDDLPLGMRVY